MTGAQIAQLVEQRIENPRVAGSIPALGTKNQENSNKNHALSLCMFFVIHLGVHLLRYASPAFLHFPLPTQHGRSADAPGIATGRGCVKTRRCDRSRRGLSRKSNRRPFNGTREREYLGFSDRLARRLEFSHSLGPMRTFTGKVRLSAIGYPPNSERIAQPSDHSNNERLSLVIPARSSWADTSGTSRHGPSFRRPSWPATRSCGGRRSFPPSGRCRG